MSTKTIEDDKLRQSNNWNDKICGSYGIDLIIVLALILCISYLFQRRGGKENRPSVSPEMQTEACSPIFTCSHLLNKSQHTATCFSTDV